MTDPKNATVSLRDLSKRDAALRYFPWRSVGRTGHGPDTIVQRGGEWSFILDLRLPIDWDPNSFGNANGGGGIGDKPSRVHMSEASPAARSASRAQRPELKGATKQVVSSGFRRGLTDRA